MLKIQKRLSNFLRDESGDDTIKNIMLLVVGALVVVALIAFGKKFMNYLNTKGDEIMEEKI